MTTRVPASMVAADVATQAELDAASLLKQTVQTVSGAVATGTAIIPRDDTIPQITEGTEFLTRAITPTAAANILEVEVVLHVSCSVTSDVVAALFRDSTANALAVASQYATTAQGVMGIVLTHRVAAGSTSPTTFRVRAGPISAGTVTVNGAAGGRYYGGAYASSITVRELLP
jgi:hypothetical protein